MTSEEGWRRPPGPPKVWRVIDSTLKLPDGRTRKISIQEIPKDRHAEAIDLMVKYYLRGEPIHTAMGVADDAETVKQESRVFQLILDQGIAVGAFIDEPEGAKPRLIGVNMLHVNTGIPEFAAHQDAQPTTELTRRLMMVVEQLHEDVLIKETLGVDKVISAFGLSTHPDYRRQKLATHILCARDDIAKEYQIPASITIFTSPYAQKAAAQAGFHVLREIQPWEFVDEKGRPILSDSSLAPFKIMAKKMAL